MQQDWIEFKVKGDRLLSLRPGYITKYSMGSEGNSDITVVMYEEGDFVNDYYVNEPYEQVKQKIMDAEKVDLSSVAVEHFTRDEYEFIKSILPMSISRVYIEHDSTGNTERLYKSIENKLNEILKEDK